MSCVIVSAALVALPAVRAGGFWWLFGAVTGGLLAGASVYQFFLNRAVRVWTADVLIPLGKESKIDFRLFVDLLDQLPAASSRDAQQKPVLLDHSLVIREVLSEFGLL
ncbi:MAG: hypothetical protein JSS02_30595 [Planctomycetes bacterium]|nr:hypothetical protein [Planctomycetota bacterium]